MKWKPKIILNFLPPDSSMTQRPALASSRMHSWVRWGKPAWPGSPVTMETTSTQSSPSHSGPLHWCKLWIVEVKSCISSLSRNPVVPCDAITIPIVDLTPWKEDARKVNEPLSSNAFHSGPPSGPSGPTPGLASSHIFPSPGFTLRQQPFLHRYPYILHNLHRLFIEISSQPPQKRHSHDSFSNHTGNQRSALYFTRRTRWDHIRLSIILPLLEYFSINIMFFVCRWHHLSTITTFTASTSTLDTAEIELPCNRCHNLCKFV